MKLNSFIFTWLLSLSLFAQESDEDVFVDNHYYEDQFYVGLQYNTLLGTKNGITNTGVPFGIEAGFIKDIPLNKKRNKGIGIGVGYLFDVSRPNVAITANGNKLDFTIDKNFSQYNYTTHNIEIPIEYRWRTSTPTNDSFWRIYTGISFIYTLSNKASFDDGNGNTTSFKNISQLNSKNFSLYTSVGFGTWNLYLKYYLKSPFKDSVRTVTGQRLNFNELKIGVMFYIL